MVSNLSKFGIFFAILWPYNTWLGYIPTEAEQRKSSSSSFSSFQVLAFVFTSFAAASNGASSSSSFVFFLWEEEEEEEKEEKQTFLPFLAQGANWPQARKKMGGIHQTLSYIIRKQFTERPRMWEIFNREFSFLFSSSPAQYVRHKTYPLRVWPKTRPRPFYPPFSISTFFCLRIENGLGMAIQLVVFWDACFQEYY